MTRLAQKILTIPGKFMTLQKVAQSYDWRSRPDKATIDGVMQNLTSSHLGVYVSNLGFVKYQLPENEDLLIYQVTPQLYKERYNTPVLPSYSMKAAAVQQLDSVARSMPDKPLKVMDQ